LTNNLNGRPLFSNLRRHFDPCKVSAKKRIALEERYRSFAIACDKDPLRAQIRASQEAQLKIALRRQV
jgi:hypothetical protein